MIHLLNCLFKVTQRVTEWRNSIGSTALAVVNDFFDSQKLYTTELRKQAAMDLLFCQRYVYFRTRDILENGVKKVSNSWYFTFETPF